jgi:methyl-accepting chemotaxis protein
MTSQLRPTSLRRKLLVPMLAIGAVLAIACGFVLDHTRRSMTELAGLTTAKTLAAETASLRRFYTEQVVGRAKQAGMGIGYDFASKERTLPLPATFVKALGEQIAKEHPGTQVRLFSRLPFPHAKATANYDGFETAALAHFDDGPADPYWSMETIDGRPSIRYAVADVMGANCVSCHNSHPESPKRDWKEGDVRGVLAITVPIDTLATGMQASANITLAAIVLGIVLLALISAWLLRRHLERPVQRLVADLSTMQATQDLTHPIAGGGNDEIGRLSACVTSFVATLRDVIGGVVGTTSRVHGATSELERASQAVANAASQQAASLEEVNATLEEMASTTKQTAANTQRASAVASSTQQAAARGKEEVRAMCTAVQEIQKSSQDISAILKTIEGIAFQTNLLALNAAVEAARAGDAGKGFAVVAEEVRSLAQRSAEAARNTAQLVASSTQCTARGAEVATRLDQTLVGLGTGVDEVAAVLAQIATASHEEAQGIALVASNVHGLDTITQQNAGTAEELAAAAKQTAGDVQSMQTRVAGFRVGAAASGEVAVGD